MSENTTWQQLNYSGVESYIKERLNKIKSWVTRKKMDLMYELFPEKMPLTFEAAEDNLKIFFCAFDETEETRTIEVSVDNGETWTEYTSRTYVGDDSDVPIAKLNNGQRILVRGNNTAMGYSSISYGEGVCAGGFFLNGLCYVYGNVMSLLDSDNYETKEVADSHAFEYLFFDVEDNWINYGLLSHPTKRLIISAKEIYEYGCSGMFKCCDRLITAPILQATLVSDYGYAYMFDMCNSLINAPELPATVMTDSCYFYMFRNCTSLTTAPALPATTLAVSCYEGMFYGCTSLTTAPELPATTLARRCYYEMFRGCRSLTTAPELPARTLAPYSYHFMFYGCTSLNYVKAMFITTPGSSYTKQWLDGVSATGTFVKRDSATWSVSGVDGIPTGWTVETASS